MAAVAGKNQQQIDPPTETVKEKDWDTVLVYVPGFRKEKLKVQLTSANILRILGERETEDANILFKKEIPLSPNIDKTKITAKFEKGILYVRLPKLNTPPEDDPDNKLPASGPQNPAAVQPPPPDQTNALRQQTTENTGQSDAGRDDPQKTLEKDEEKAKNDKGTNVNTVDSGSLGGQRLKEEKPQRNDTSSSGKGINENVDGSGKTRLENYKGTAVDLAAKLRTSRRGFYVVLIALAAVGLGLYVINVIRSFRTSKI